MKKQLSLRLQSLLAAFSLVLLAGSLSDAQAQMSPARAQKSSARTPYASLQSQNLIVGEYFNRQAIEFAANGSRLGVFVSTTGVGRFHGLAFDSTGHLHVAGVQTNNVRRFCSTGMDVGNFILGLNSPTDVAIDPQGNVYVACAGDSAIRRFSPTGADLGAFASVPGVDSITFNAEGVLFATSYTTNSVRRIAPTGQNLGSFATVAQPTGLAFDAAGNLYVASSGANTIRRFSPQGTDLGVFAASGLNDPRGIAFDLAGNLYVANYAQGYGNAVRRFSPTGADLGNFATGLNAPVDLAFRPAPLPPVSISGHIELQECLATYDVPVTLTLRPDDGCPATHYAVTPDSIGNFAIPNVPRMRYQVSVKGSKWLRHTRPIDITGGESSGNAFYLIAGDANGDNAINSLDLDILVQAFDTVPGQGRWNPLADFNCDDSVDVYDLDLLVRNFDRVGDP